MLLIATDEAGYGPKLGPLVIVATAWRVPRETLIAEELADLFSPLQTPQPCGGCQVVVDDSKAVYKSSGGLDVLHAVVSASHHWCGKNESTLQEQLPRIAADDLQAIQHVPWLGLLSESQFLSQSVTSELLQQWRSTGIELSDVRARVITAEQFNTSCGSGSNKADLLSESTLGLVRALSDLHGQDEPTVAVFCDRHGGRKYYGGVLQHLFADARLQVASEEKQQSGYRLTRAKQQINVCFTVKGDSFTPVALSSMHAKYLRERFMESFNQFFALRHKADAGLTPTAGYPVDADRFLADVASTLEREKIARQTLVRSR
jgi:ribonuclease HII